MLFMQKLGKYVLIMQSHAKRSQKDINAHFRSVMPSIQVQIRPKSGPKLHFNISAQNFKGRLLL